MPTDLTGTPTSLGIGTYNVDADAPSGLGFNAAMGQIDALIAARATVASPTFTGTPAAPTPAPGDISTKIATTSFVSNAISGLAPLASPTFTGTPAAPTPATADNSTKLATTAFVKAQGYITSIGTVVNTFNGRSGTVVPTSGDYTAAQVTNAADKSSSSTQSFTGTIVSSGFLTAINSNTGATSFNLTPDLSAGNYAVGTCTSGGANSLINNPVNPPSGSQSALLLVEGRNTGGSSSNLTWGTAYSFSNFVKPSAIAGGGRMAMLFAWSPSDSTWRAVGTF